jgi:hypothetical protein
VRFPKFSAALLAVVAPVAVAGALAVSVAPASASVHGVKPQATVACQPECTNIYNEQWGPEYIQAVSSGKYNAPVLIRHASNSAKSEDFIVSEVGTLGQLCTNALHPGGLIPENSYSCLNYPSFWPVFQAEYAPGSFTSGFCIGVAGKATNDKKVVLRDCGAAAHTLWVADLKNDVPDVNSLFPFGDTPLVNASDSSFSNPIALTFEGIGKQLKVTEEALNGGQVGDNQEFGETLVS